MEQTNIQVNSGPVNNGLEQTFKITQNITNEFTRNVTVIRQVSQQVNIVNQTIGQVNQNVGQVEQNIKRLELGDVVGKVGGIAGAVAKLTGPGPAFEQSMAGLSAATGIVGDDLLALQQAARQTGRESGIGAQAAAEAFSTLAAQVDVGKVGIEGLQTLQQNTLTLSQAAGVSMGDAATALTGALGGFGLEASEAGRVINVLAAGSRQGGLGIAELSESLGAVGATAAAAGLSVEDATGALDVLSQGNIKGAEAGEALREVMLGMQQSLGIDLGATGLAPALESLTPKLGDAAYLAGVFGEQNVAAAQALIGNAGAVAEMTAKVTDTNTAQEQAAQRTDTTQQMIERCRARVDDLKIGFFELTGSAGGYATVIAEQAGAVTEMLPLFELLGQGLSMVTNAQTMSALWTGIVKTATTVWTGVQWALNASLWGCPLMWIVGGVAALVAVVALCATKVQGWGKQWSSIVNFMKLTGQLFVETIKFEFDTMVNGIMLGLDYVKLGWYKFKKACGLGDSAENEAMIDQLSGSIEQRKTAITEGAQKLKDLAAQAGKSLTWELSAKKGDKEPSAEDAQDGKQAADGAKGAGKGLTGRDFGGDFGGMSGGGNGFGSMSGMLGGGFEGMSSPGGANGFGNTNGVPGNSFGGMNGMPGSGNGFGGMNSPGAQSPTAAAAPPATRTAAGVPTGIPATTTTAAMGIPDALKTMMTGGSAVATASKTDAAVLPALPTATVNVAAGASAALEQATAHTGASAAGIPASGLNELTGNPASAQKGSTGYQAIASRLAQVRVPSLAAAAASVAMPLAVAATSLPQDPAQAMQATTEYADAQPQGGISAAKFCDTVEIHIANADGKGYNQIEQEITNVLKKVLDNYEA